MDPVILELMCVLGIFCALVIIAATGVIFLRSISIRDHIRATRRIKNNYGIIWNPRKLAFLYYKEIKDEFLKENEYSIIREFYSIISSYLSQFFFSATEGRTRSERRFERMREKYEMNNNQSEEIRGTIRNGVYIRDEHEERPNRLRRMV